MPKKVLIIDDEKLARDRISRYIAELNYDFQLLQAASGLEALEILESETPDILFLDIQMPGITGLEMLQQIENRPFKIIFQTAYDQYAIQAFEENACDYLLKPFDRGRFKSAVDRVMNDIDRIQKLDLLEEKLQRQSGYLQKLSIRQGGQLKVIDLTDVVGFISQDHCTCVHTKDAEFISDLSLSHLEKRLDPQVFMRCHRNNIVRIDAVQSIGVGPNMTVQLSSELIWPVARGKRDQVRGRVLSE